MLLDRKAANLFNEVNIISLIVCNIIEKSLFKVDKIKHEPISDSYRLVWYVHGVTELLMEICV